MARARNIKPAFFDNDELAEIPALGRLLFIGLWTLCDYKGNLEWREKRIKKQLLAYDNCDVNKLAINLDKSGFIRFYSEQDKIFVNIVNFNKHQNPHKNERDKGSDIPKWSEEASQLIDLTTLTINRDLSGLKRSDSTSNPADSLILIPDSPTLIPEEVVSNLSIELAFDHFWSAGMRKVNKKKSLSSFKSIAKKHCNKDFTVEQMAECMHQDVRQRLSNNQLGFAEMHPTTYINGERWNDEQVQTRHASNNEQTGTAAQRTAAAFEQRNNQRDEQASMAMDDRVGTIRNQMDSRLGNNTVDNSGESF